MKHTTFPLAAIVAALALAGCGGSSDEAEPAGGAPAAGAAIPGGGLTIAEAIASTAEAPLLVKGFLVGAGGELRLCASAPESYSVRRCGEPSLRVEGYEGGARPTEQVSLLGAVADGVLTVDPTAIASG